MKRVARRAVLVAATLPPAWLALVLTVTSLAPPPRAVGLAGPPRSAAGARFLADDSWLDAAGERVLEQTIFDAVFRAIDGARHFVHVDMFLFNDFQGPEPETHRALSAELVRHLAAAARRPDGPAVVVVTDPINTLYGGRRSPELEALRRAGAHVVTTDLTTLQDSNPAWSGFWRTFVRPFGNVPGDSAPNPLGPGRATVRSWLALANFKANHRKLLVVDASPAGKEPAGDESAGNAPAGNAPAGNAPRTDVSVPEGANDAGDGVREGLAIVTSANPHDGSSAHRNVALAVRGPIVADLLAAERGLLTGLASGPDAGRALAAFDAALARAGLEPTPLGLLESLESLESLERGGAAAPAIVDASASVALANESAILREALRAVNAAGAGDAVDLEMFYLADVRIVAALEAAVGRGATVRALLDVNSDAFGRAKNGVPNRPVAATLVAAGAAVRWCATGGEQCHAKWLHVRTGASHVVLLGSGNFTRRNLRDYNLETDLVYRAGDDDPELGRMLKRFGRLWSNPPGRTYSLPYETKADEGYGLAWQYRFMERTGLGTF